MHQRSTKITNWQNGLLLSAVSYALYIIWLVLDNDTSRQLQEIAVTDYLIDFLLCMLFTYTSLGFCYVVFKFSRSKPLISGSSFMLRAC